eukprot:1140557-Pelagomonas_calceolata.AAC.3
MNEDSWSPSLQQSCRNLHGVYILTALMASLVQGSIGDKQAAVSLHMNLIEYERIAYIDADVWVSERVMLGWTSTTYNLHPARVLLGMLARVVIGSKWQTQ